MTNYSEWMSEAWEETSNVNILVVLRESHWVDFNVLLAPRAQYIGRFLCSRALSNMRCILQDVAKKRNLVSVDVSPHVLGFRGSYEKPILFPLHGCLI